MKFIFLKVCCWKDIVGAQPVDGSVKALGFRSSEVTTVDYSAKVIAFLFEFFGLLDLVGWSFVSFKVLGCFG